MGQQTTIGKHKTTITTDNDNITRIRYHSTNVVSFDHGTIELNTGGFTTATTKTRMNQASNQFNLGFKVYQKDFQFFVDYHGKTFSLDGRLWLDRSMLDKPCSGLDAKCECIICVDYRRKAKKSA